MKLSILKINQPVFMGDLESITLPTISDGEIQVLPDHSSYMSALKKGEIKYLDNGEVKKIEIEKGFVEVNRDEVLVVL